MGVDPGDEHDVVVGVVGKPFGTRGEVYVHPDPDIMPTLAPGESYRRSEGPPLVVAEGHVHAGRTIVRFEGVEDREGAEGLRGQRLLIARDQLVTDEDTFWVADLLGREVVDPDGAVIGVVEAVRDGMAHDYLVVARPDGGEVVVPAVEELLDIAADHVVVRLVEGL